MVWNDAYERVKNAHYAGLFQMVALYLLGRHWPVEIEKNALRNMAIVLFAVCITILLNAAALDAGGIFRSEFIKFNYQGTALALLVMTALTVPSLAGKTKWIVIFTVCSSFIAVGARSEFIAFFISVIFIQYLQSKGNPQKLLKWALSISIFLTVSVSILSIWFPESRIWGLFDLANDGSYLARSELLTETWDTISQNIITGSYGDYRVGYYAHNILSAWVDTGLGGACY